MRLGPWLELDAALELPAEVLETLACDRKREPSLLSMTVQERMTDCESQILALG